MGPWLDADRGVEDLVYIDLLLVFSGYGVDILLIFLRRTVVMAYVRMPILSSTRSVR